MNEPTDWAKLFADSDRQQAEMARSGPFAKIFQRWDAEALSGKRGPVAKVLAELRQKVLLENDKP
jgi:hypothetical protein